MQHTRNFQDEAFSDASEDELTKLRPLAESSPVPAASAAPPQPQPPASASINDKFSLTVTITPVGLLLVGSLAVNLTLLYLYATNA